MGRHREEFEQPSSDDAGEPDGQQPASRRWLNRTALLGAVVVVVAILGTTIWVFSSRSPSVEGFPPDTTTSATRGAKDGFGEATLPPGGPSGDPTTPAGRPSRTTGASPLPGSSASPSGQPAAPPRPDASTPEATVTAKYTMTVWQGAYKLDFVVANRTSAASLWTVRLEVPSGARVAQTWNTEVSQQSATVWLFKPPLWEGGNPKPIPAGGEFGFGLIVQGGQTVVSCTIDGKPCQR